MPLNQERLNSSGNQPELKRPIPRPQEQESAEPHFKQQDLGQQKISQPAEQIQEQAASAIAGLKQADLTYAGQAFERLGEQFELDTDRIAQTAEILLDPRVKVAAGILKAADAINARKDEGLQLPFGGYSFVQPRIPGVPSFSQFYSHCGEQGQPLLSSSSSGCSDS